MGALEAGFSRLEKAQRETNRGLGRLEATLGTASRVLELMHGRLEKLEEGQQTMVESQRAMVEGQKQVVERLDRLVTASTRDRTEQVERLARLELRVDSLEKDRS